MLACTHILNLVFLGFLDMTFHVHFGYFLFVWGMKVLINKKKPINLKIMDVRNVLVDGHVVHVDNYCIFGSFVIFMSFELSITIFMDICENHPIMNQIVVVIQLLSKSVIYNPCVNIWRAQRKENVKQESKKC